MKKLFAVLAALCLVAVFAVPSMAAEATLEDRLKSLEDAFQCSWKFYGSARFTTFWDDVSKEQTGSFDDDDLTWNLQGNSRIGAVVKVADLKGQFEYGHGPNPTLRLLYGEWNFGSGKFLIGQDYTPMTYWISNQVWGGDNDLLGFGQLYMGRVPQVKLTFGNFQIAAISPNTAIPAVQAGALPAGYAWADTDTSIPRLVAGYTFNAGPLNLHLAGAYGTFDAVAEQGVVSEKEYSVDAYQLALGAKFASGPFYLKGDVYFGDNLRNLGQSHLNTYGFAVYDGVGDSICDAEGMGYAASAGFKANDMITFEIGYGVAENELSCAGVGYEADQRSYYLQATINLAKGVFVVPEIGKVDYGDRTVAGVDTDQGDRTYFGAKWQINF